MLASTPIIGMWLAVLVTATLSMLAWRERPNPGATAFSATMAIATWWLLANAGGVTASGKALRIAWANLEWMAIVVLPVAWLWFCLEYTGRTEQLTSRFAGLLLVIPASSIAVIWTDGTVHDLFRTAVTATELGGVLLLEVTPGPWYWLAVGHTYLLLLAGVFVLLELWFEEGTIHRIQVGALLVAVLFPSVIGLGYMAGIPPLNGMNPTPIAIVVSSVIIGGAITRLDLFGTVPVPSRVARDEVVEGMDDAVVVVDTADRIVDCNARGAAVVGRTTEGAIGLDATEYVPGYDRARSADGNTVTVTHERGDNQRYLDVRVTPFDDDVPQGAVVVLRDVTADRRREQRLDVLNRVLRHNLRNDLNVVHGYAEYLERVEAYDEEAVEKIKTRSESLMSIGNKARRIETFLDGEAVEPVEVAPLLDHEADRIRDQYDDVEVVVEALPDRGWSDGTIGPVVRDLLENAVEHNTNDRPVVRLEARRHGGELLVRVSDNGPGLPEAERTVLESGRETPLEHTSGLGLWLVVWGIREMNGTVSFDAPADGGCTVTVRIPVLDESPDDEEETTEVEEPNATAVDPGDTPVAGPD